MDAPKATSTPTGPKTAPGSMLQADETLSPIALKAAELTVGTDNDKMDVDKDEEEVQLISDHVDLEQLESGMLGM
jgi:hypothetical protein